MTPRHLESTAFIDASPETCSPSSMTVWSSLRHTRQGVRREEGIVVQQRGSARVSRARGAQETGFGVVRHLCRARMHELHVQGRVSFSAAASTRRISGPLYRLRHQQAPLSSEACLQRQEAPRARR